MKPRSSLATKFLVPALVLLAGLALLLNFAIAGQVKQSLIKQAASFVVDFGQLQARQHNITADDFSFHSPAQTQQAFDRYYGEIHTKNIIRLKAWRTDATVVYSDDSTLVGQQFKDNAELADAIKTGQPQIEITKPSKAENVAEKQYSELMEIYIPITQPGSDQLAGVVETYYELSNLTQTLNQASLEIALIVGGGFVLLALALTLLLNGLVLRPVRRLQMAAENIGKGKFDTLIVVRSHDELGVLAQAFNRMTGGLVRLQELKNEFVFVAAHELRAPVTIIKGYLSLFGRKPSAQDRDDYITEISSANQRLEQLVEDLLEIARSDSGKLTLKPEPVDVAGLIQRTAKSFAQAAAERKIKLVADHDGSGLWTLADEKRLEEVLANLVSNAIKYGLDSGYVEIEAFAKDGQVVIKVEDNGLGISAEAKKHLFEKFYRAPEATSSGVVGTGLGLYITKELVERMQGSIAFSSEVGKGTVFTVTLPASEKTK